MSAEFSLKRDFRFIAWGRTIQFNIVRSVIASVIWAIVLAAGEGRTDSLTIAAALPIGYLGILMPIGVVAGWLASLGVPFVGWYSIIFALVVIVADPVIFVLHRWLPRLLPIKDPGFLNLKLIIFLVDEEKRRNQTA